MNELGRIVREARESLGMSLREAANRTGTSHGYIHVLEIGVNSGTGKASTPTPEILKRLADGLGLDFRMLMEVAGHPVPEDSSQAEELNTLFRKASPALRKAVLDLLRASVSGAEEGNGR